MVGRLHNKARKERIREIETRAARELDAARALDAQRRAEAFEKRIDTPGSGFLRFACLCGHSVIIHHGRTRFRLYCKICGEGWQSVL